MPNGYFTFIPIIFVFHYQSNLTLALFSTVSFLKIFKGIPSSFCFLSKVYVDIANFEGLPETNSTLQPTFYHIS